jgi:hypothetical protein
VEYTGGRVDDTKVRELFFSTWWNVFVCATSEVKVPTNVFFYIISFSFGI